MKKSKKGFIKYAINRLFIKCAFIALLNTLLSFLIIFYRPIIPIIRSAEIELYGYSAGIKRTILGLHDDKPSNEEIIFVNTSNENEFILNDYGNEVIVNRKTLTECLKKINTIKDSIRLVVCDIQIANESIYDSLLLKEIVNLKGKIISPKDCTTIYTKKATHFWAEVEEIHGTLVQYPLKYHTELTYPTGIFQMLHPKTPINTYAGFLPFINIGGSIFPERVIIEPRIRVEHIEQRQQSKNAITDTLKPYYPMENLGSFTKFFVPQTLKNKIIVIGNFSENGNDKHMGIVPYTYGALAVMNTYLMIENGDSVISFSWLFSIGLLLFLYFMREQIYWFKQFITQKRFVNKRIKGYYAKIIAICKKNLPDKVNCMLSKIRISLKKAGINENSLILSILSSIGFVTVIALISYLVFNFHIEYILINLLIAFEIIIMQVTIFVKTLFSKQK